MAAPSVSMQSLDLDRLQKRPGLSILKIAAPTVAAMLLQSAVNEVDVWFFKHLPGSEGTNAQAALAPSLIMLWLFGGSISAISVGTQAFTGRREAEGNHEAAGAVLANSVWFCVLAGLFQTLLGALTIPMLLARMIKVPEVLHVASDYCFWRLFGFISMATTIGIKSFFDGVGKTHVHLIASLVMNIFNVLFCWMFIFGNLGAPRMGAPGAGLGAFMSTWIGLAIVVFYAMKQRNTYRPFRRSNLNRSLLWSMVKLSAPAAIATIVMMGGFGVFISFAGKLDAPPPGSTSTVHEAINGAATTNIIALMKLTFTACLAFGTATATFVSQSLGAKKPELAARFGWASVRVGLVVFAVIGLMEGVLFTRPIIHFIAESTGVQEAMMTPLRIMGMVTPVLAVAMILIEALFGAGNTVFVAVAQFLMIFLLLLPLAWLLSLKLGYGLNGMWMAAAVYATVAAVAMSFKFWRGEWKKISL